MIDNHGCKLNLTNGHCSAAEHRRRIFVHSYFKAIALTAALVIPVAISAQDRDHQDRRQNDQQRTGRYEDKAHNDTHEWNNSENQRYRQYLQEHHKKYHNFANAKQKEQNDYWNWVHSHPG
jgi:hypothetical protein